MGVRFSPDACPGCGEPLRPKYSTYRFGARHWLYRVGLVGGAFAVLGLGALTFWGAFELAEVLLGDAGLGRRDRGVLTFLIQLVMLALIGVGARVAWGALHRLPRTFTAGCETCTWTGPCQVFETSASG
jgi:hypothetical protein